MVEALVWIIVSLATADQSGQSKPFEFETASLGQGKECPAVADTGTTGDMQRLIENAKKNINERRDQGRSDGTNQ